MPESVDMSAWQRLGRMLERRRVELDTRYSNLSLFTAERGVDYRMAWDLEHGARTNYRRPTLMAAEVSYGWKPGSIESVLAGGEPLLAEPGPLPEATCTFEYSILGEPYLSDAEKESFIRRHRAGGHQLCKPLQEEPEIRRAAGLRA